MTLLVRGKEPLTLGGSAVETYRDVVETYRNRHDQLGSVAESFFYRSREQQARKLAEIGSLVRRLVSPRDSVLDVGCGFGDLHRHLPPCIYSGIDVVPEFVSEAARRVPAGRFVVGNVMHHRSRYDWVIAACVLSSVPDPDEVLERCWHLARVGVCFDLIDKDKVPAEFGDLHKFDTAETEERLRQELGRVVTRDRATSWTSFLVLKSSAK